MEDGQIGQNGAYVPWNVAVKIKHAQGLVQTQNLCSMAKIVEKATLKHELAIKILAQ
jgi:hypothetical protein